MLLLAFEFFHIATLLSSVRLDGSPGIYENLEAMLYSRSKYGFVSKIQSMQLFEEWGKSFRLLEPWKLPV